MGWIGIVLEAMTGGGAPVWSGSPDTPVEVCNDDPMRVLLQRVAHASVAVDGAIVGEISRGLLLLVGFKRGDTASQLRPLAEKVVNLRVFPGEKGDFDRSVLDIGGGVLSVSQFTLYADTRKGRRPDFAEALDATSARELFLEWCRLIQSLGVVNACAGVFQATMRVHSQNEGPVTVLLGD